MTLDDALLWLNDRLGKSVTVWIAVEHGDTETSILEATGVLEHWSEGRAGARAVGREDIAGLYDVGGASFDLSDVQPLGVETPLADHLVIRLDQNTTLQVLEQAET